MTSELLAMIEVEIKYGVMEVFKCRAKFCNNLVKLVDFFIDFDGSLLESRVIFLFNCLSEKSFSFRFSFLRPRSYTDRASTSTLWLLSIAGSRTKK